MNIRKRLLISIGSILTLTQIVIAFWVWHEAQEQIEILTDAKLTAMEKNALVEHELNETLLALSLPSIGLVIIALFLTYWSIKRITEPLSRLTHEINHKHGYDLSPIIVPNNSLEVNTIVEKLNLLLARISKNLNNERRFTADVAHELRTPLAGLRLNLEMVDAELLPEKQIFIQRIDQLLLTIEQLLNLARAGNKLQSQEQILFNLQDEVIYPLQQELEEFPHDIQWNIPDNIEIHGDSSLIYLLLKNIMDNIRYYAPNSVETIFNVEVRNDFLHFNIIDNGPGVSENQLSILTQRFKRIDESRKGFGLGLNIAERVCHVHNGELVIQNRNDGQSGLVISIALPL